MSHAQIGKPAPTDFPKEWSARPYSIKKPDVKKVTELLAPVKRKAFLVVDGRAFFVDDGDVMRGVCMYWCVGASK